MKGNGKWQAKEILKRSGLNKIGTSKHAAKAEARNVCRQLKIPTTSRNIAPHMGIHSIQTMNTYLGTWTEVFNHNKTHFGLKDITKVNASHIQHFLESKIETGVRLKTFRTYAAACEKLAVTLELFSIRVNSHTVYDFSPTIQAARETASQLLNGTIISRSYEAPDALIRHLESPLHRLAASIQYQSGARVNDIATIDSRQLLGFQHDPLSGETKGRIAITQSKGGKSGELQIQASTYNLLKDTITKGEYALKLHDYRADLKRAAGLTGQTYHSTHGLRWCFAQHRFREVQMKGGVDYDKALSIVSREMFHKRAKITLHYLR